MRAAAERGDVDGALAALDHHRLLCAHRDGPFGVRLWNRRIEAWLTAETGDPLYDRAYVGRPLLVTANDHQLGIYNGDSGVVVLTPTGPDVASLTATPTGLAWAGARGPGALSAGSSSVTWRIRAMRTSGTPTC